jgi:hypothetical protein
VDTDCILNLLSSARSKSHNKLSFFFIEQMYRLMEQ